MLQNNILNVIYFSNINKNKFAIVFFELTTVFFFSNIKLQFFLKKYKYLYYT